MRLTTKEELFMLEYRSKEVIALKRFFKELTFILKLLQIILYNN